MIRLGYTPSPVMVCLPGVMWQLQQGGWFRTGQVVPLFTGNTCHSYPISVIAMEDVVSHLRHYHG